VQLWRGVDIEMDLLTVEIVHKLERKNCKRDTSLYELRASGNHIQTTLIKHMWLWAILQLGNTITRLVYIYMAWPTSHHEYTPLL
jgi:hypothetical protein